MTSKSQDLAPAAGAYAPVNGLEMYYEVHGTGRPLVLLHGGLLTIDSNFGPMLPAFATSRQVVAVELQGHGRTADIDREFTLEHLADDVAGLLDHLGIARADLFGFSLGGLVSTEFAIRHPQRVDRMVLGSSHVRQDGYHEEIRDPESHPGSTRMPTSADFAEMKAAYEEVAPDPDHFEAFAARLSAMVSAFRGWPEDAVRAITAPTLIIVGDNDFTRLEHAVEMTHLLPGARLAVLPDTTHMAMMRRTEHVVPMVETFLGQARPEGSAP
ncbi:alpha/beta fold hydrolase [Actinopolymorpha pittospori]|uniref:Pimeloyl-ACP methyl ester carboxylesterase n=1 Tax=Actinopolymorpha pittospori TaxID=648752 RepID=A0A927MTJ9_9ACTN|nr:alpha/beta fold hydrolase [Actinopolymorpha pittospori]MBE1606665.1 pimeloyl-ACP methyl ester carboxylesterase [Actinopolymorpha pittospori]